MSLKKVKVKACAEYRDFLMLFMGLILGFLKK